MIISNRKINKDKNKDIYNKRYKENKIEPEIKIV